MKSILSIIGIVYVLLAASFLEAAETVKVAAIFALTGDAAAPNTLHMQAIRFAVAELNQQGGLLGKQVELIELDNKSTALGSKVAATKAVKEGVIGVIGASWSSHSLAMAPVLQEAGIPMISPYSTNPQVTLVGDYIFRVCFLDPFQGTVVANFAVKDLNAKKAVVLVNTGGTYSIELAQVFINKFQQFGGEVLWKGDYREDAMDFAALLDKVVALQPDVIFIPGYERDSGLIMKQARSMGVSSTFLGADGWTELVYDYAGTAHLESYYSTHWHPGSPSEKSQQFVKKYTQQYEEIKDPGIALAYDAFYLLVDAVQRANSLDPKHIRDALAATKNFEGVTGTITIDKNGDPVKPAVILKYEQDGSVFVKMIKP